MNNFICLSSYAINLNRVNYIKWNFPDHEGVPSIHIVFDCDDIFIKHDTEDARFLLNHFQQKVTDLDSERQQVYQLIGEALAKELEALDDET
ncbi:MAG: hypothetical protein RID09_07025 [Coleofasciculus sp. G1-WW12-02]|uniref:hypothetical protein n=1 Tax=Coleofasciculus sp. G1-WW12-02 TaxID=3068483 RepID=UPI0032F23CF7